MSKKAASRSGGCFLRHLHQKPIIEIYLIFLYTNSEYLLRNDEYAKQPLGQEAAFLGIYTKSLLLKYI